MADENQSNKADIEAAETLIIEELERRGDRIQELRALKKKIIGQIYTEQSERRDFADRAAEIDFVDLPVWITLDQREQVKEIKERIGTLEEEYNRGAPKDELYRQLVTRYGEYKSDYEDKIDRLLTRGEIYEPSHGHLRKA